MFKHSSDELLAIPASKASLLFLLGIATVFLGSSIGCRSTTDNQIDLLERELRVQEDYIYELEDYLVEYSDKLRDCRSCTPQQMAVYSEEVEQPRPEPRRTQKKASPKRQQEQSLLKQEPEELPATEKELETPDFSPEDIEVPENLELELDDPQTNIDDAQPLMQVAASEEAFEADDEELFIPDPVDYEPTLADQPIEDQEAEEQFNDEPVDETFQVEPLEAIERIAERLEVKQLFHGAGDELSPLNLLTVVEGLDANDEPVDLDGEVSLMVMTDDAAAPKRLKRWNFTPEETASAWQSSDLGDGLHLELPLEKMQLPAGPLELWVRLVTADGRKLLTQLPFEPNQLRDVASVSPISQPPASLALVEEEPELEPVNPLRPASAIKPSSEQTALAKASPAKNNQPRWRASMHRTDQSDKNFATTSGKSQGWTKQAWGRQTQANAQVANRTQTNPATAAASQPPVSSSNKQTPTRPTWSAVR